MEERFSKLWKLTEILNPQNLQNLVSPLYLTLKKEEK